MTKYFLSVWSFFLTLSKSTKRVTCNFCIHLTLQCITTTSGLHPLSELVSNDHIHCQQICSKQKSTKFWFQFKVGFIEICCLVNFGEKNAFLDDKNLWIQDHWPLSLLLRRLNLATGVNIMEKQIGWHAAKIISASERQQDLRRNMTWQREGRLQVGVHY